MKYEEFTDYWKEIVGITIDCSNKHYAVWPNPIGSQMHKRKNDLLYRCNSIYWHIGILNSVVNSINDRSKIEKSDLQGIVYEEWDKVHFLFDDVIFNLISAFDYFASLVHIIMTDKKDEFKKWNNVVKKSRDKGYKFPDTETMIIDFHGEWVNKLSGYRANVYHEKTDKPSAVLQDDFFFDKREIEFNITDKAAKELSIEKNTNLIDAINILLDKSLYIQRDILKCCVEEKHNRAS